MAKKQAKTKVAAAVIETVGAQRYEALLSPEQIKASTRLVDVLVEAKISSGDTKALCRSIVLEVFPVGREPDKATWVEWVGGMSEQVATSCYDTIKPPKGETEEQAVKRYNGLKGYAAKALREAYTVMVAIDDDGEDVTTERALPEAGQGKDGAVPQGMNIDKAARYFGNKANAAITQSAKLADYPFDGAMLLAVAKWCEETTKLIDALKADADASEGRKAA